MENIDINLQDYEIMMFHGAPDNHECIVAAELLGLDLDPSATNFEERVKDYIDKNYQWCRNDEEYRYMGYDCGDCYMGGDIKEGILCGDYLVVYATSPNYKKVHIYKKS